jgi:hypothetical protein
MCRSLTSPPGWALALAGLLVGLPGPARAAELPAAGSWKVTVLSQGQEITLWLVKVDDKGGQPRATVLAGAGGFKASTVENARVADGALRLVFRSNNTDYTAAGYLPPGEAAPRKLLGFIEVRGQRDFLQWERTDQAELDPKKAVVNTPALEAFQKLRQIKGAEEQQTAVKEILEKSTGQPAYMAGAMLLQLLARDGAAEAELRALADRNIQTASPHGREMELEATHQAARTLTGSEKRAALGLPYARKAEQLLREADPATVRSSVLKTAASALRKAGQEAEAKAVDARVAQLEEVLDQEFLKTAIPFAPEKFAGRQGKSNRVVVLELFTGAQCPPCVSADIAFDALLKTYQPSEVVLLQYHLHIPGPDPLTNADAEKRAEYYEVNSTPAAFVNGKEGPQVGGFKQHAQDRYKELRKALDEQLEAEPQARLKLSADRKGDQINIHAEVAGLKQPGEDVRLRLVVIEDVVRYAGRNGQRLHHHVVRALPGGVDGIALKEGAAKQTVTVRLPELSQTLRDYLTDKSRRFLDEERPLELKHLKVVALVQDNKSKEVLQATQVEVTR